MLLYKHLYCLVLSLSRALSLSVIDHLCVLLQTAWAGPSIPGVVSRTMLEPGVSEIGAVVGSYSADHRVDNSVELPHVRCIAERAK